MIQRAGLNTSQILKLGGLIIPKSKVYLTSVIGRELVYSTRYDANRKPLKLHPLSIKHSTKTKIYKKQLKQPVSSLKSPIPHLPLTISSKKPFHYNYSGTLGQNSRKLYEKKNITVAKQYFQFFCFRLQEASGEWESRAWNRSLPVRQSKSDSKMG